ncbi:hypothetical protein GCM10010260_53830 [Streptomyces filipinensis]|uniref:Uncharacterized protein n=1 Tax=Streptomyces filipinensis TaxID=66887 RepID=A0A918IEY0_9ACTN|nr:hypothetical protein GCM10010260_53830 [Streptomyces filipinensis]
MLRFPERAPALKGVWADSAHEFALGQNHAVVAARLSGGDVLRPAAAAAAAAVGSQVELAGEPAARAAQSLTSRTTSTRWVRRLCQGASP